MKRKTEEIFSKALYADNPDLYLIFYRDYDEIKSMKLKDFLKEEIPSHRIIKITRAGKTVYRKK